MSDLNVADNSAEIDAAGDVDAEEGFLSLLEKEESGSTPDSNAEKETENESDVSETETKTEDDPDDIDVELPYGNENKKHKVKDIKIALEKYETSARVEQEARAASEKAMADQARFLKGTQDTISRLDADYKAKFGHIDWATFQSEVTPEVYKAYLTEARADWDRKEAIKAAYEAETSAIDTKNREKHDADMQACLKSVFDPEKGIKGLTREDLVDMVKFATEMGAPEVQYTTSPTVVKLLHMAWQQSKGQAAAQEQIKKVVHQPSRVIRPGASNTTNTKTSAQAAIAKAKSGNDDDIINAFAAFC